MKKLLALLLLFGIVGCEQEPTQLEKCVVVNYEKMYENILLSEQVIEQDRLNQRSLLANKELADKFWLEAERAIKGFKDGVYDVYGEEPEVFNSELSLVSFFALYPTIEFIGSESISVSDYFFSDIPTINELDNILRITSLWNQISYELDEEDEEDERDSIEFILVDYYSALKDYNMSYYSDSEPVKDIELSAMNRTNSEATELCNSQGIY